MSITKFDPNHYEQLESNIEKEDYLNLTIIGPARIQVKKQLTEMTQDEISEAFKMWDVHYLSALENRLVANLTNIRFKLYNITFYGEQK